MGGIFPLNSHPQQTRSQIRYEGLSSRATSVNRGRGGNVTETGFERVARQGRLPAWISSPTVFQHRGRTHS